MARHLNGQYMTAAGVAYTGQGILIRAILYSETEGGASITLYDNTSGTTNPLSKISVDPAVGGGQAKVTKTFEIHREFENGVNVAWAGTGILTLVFG